LFFSFPTTSNPHHQTITGLQYTAVEAGNPARKTGSSTSASTNHAPININERHICWKEIHEMWRLPGFSITVARVAHISWLGLAALFVASDARFVRVGERSRAF